MSSKDKKHSDSESSKKSSRRDSKRDSKPKDEEKHKSPQKSKAYREEESGSDSESDFAVRVVRAPQNTAILERAAHIEQQRNDGRFDDPNDLSLDSSSSDVSEDDDAEMADPILDDFLSMIPKLASHDPEIYDKEKMYFPPEIEVEEKEKGEKKVTYKDMVRRNILDRVARGDDAGSDMDDDEELEAHSKKTGELSYAQEQELAKKEMLAAAWGDDDDSDAGEAADEAGLVKIAPTSEKKAAEEAEYTAFAAAAAATTTKVGEAKRKPGSSILGYWTRKDLDEDEMFLRDYVLNKRWAGGADAGTSTGRTDLALVDDEDDTKDLEKQDDFETAYNFRFEDPNGNQLVSHARSQPDSVRVETNKRADARARKRERKRLAKQAAEEEKIEEKKKMKAEILARIGELSAVSGLTDEAKKLVKEGQDEEWDPERHDATMESTFGEEYYAHGEKHRPDVAAAGDIEDVEAWLAKVKATAKKTGGAVGTEEIEKALEDYYNLDYDESIGEDRVRFRYTQVPKQDYGLTNEELLNMSDSELDTVIPMKKLAAYREDGGKMKKHRIAFKRREWAAAKRAEKDAAKAALKGAFDESRETSKKKKRRRDSVEGSEGAETKPVSKKSKVHEAN